jgi:hypothetical protein
MDLLDNALKPSPEIHGEFFTPIPFANKALDYLEKTF